MGLSTLPTYPDTPRAEPDQPGSDSTYQRQAGALFHFGVTTLLPLLICVGIAAPTLLGEKSLLQPESWLFSVFGSLSGLVPFWLAVRGCQLVTGRTRVSADGVPAGLLVIGATWASNLWLSHTVWRISNGPEDSFGNLLETYGAVAQIAIVSVPTAIAYYWSRYAKRF